MIGSEDVCCCPRAGEEAQQEGLCQLSQYFFFEKKRLCVVQRTDEDLPQARGGITLTHYP